ncbi:Ig-like domain-containing protein [Paracerasibacillus soli]|uniref:Ig-like domain-containing protein n=1 Tax=Paracerasibacillus soli TaxID=480284 RepID=A0ABU5CQP4_9BACI|nr:Ig-like domain-containing protein [Virgibacillus soli]MDY0408696.1 Ig-like domain-containing protein [Virgibacillus soli]
MSFTVDNIAPEMSISSISRYNNEAKTVKVTVNEHNYAKNKVDIQIKRENPDGTIQNYSPSWKNEGTTTTLDIPFTDDALYHIVVNATDDAGNKAKEKSATFTIDTIKPKLSIQGVENTNEVKHYNESKDVTFKVTDTNIDKEKTVLIVKRLNRGTGKMENVNVGKLAFTKTKAELKYRFSQEGLYTVELHATDKARNQAEPVKITFVIDKTAPVLSIDNVTDHAYYPANRIVAVNVQETNFKSNDVTFTVTKDGVDITNEVEGSARNASWANEKSNAKLTYNFKEDGTYTISIQAQDLAGNKAKSQQKSFTIDKTNPVIDISVLRKGSTITRINLFMSRLKMLTLKRIQSESSKMENPTRLGDFLLRIINIRILWHL